MATIALKARTVGADRALRRFTEAADRLPRDTLEGQRELGREAEIVYASHAPVKSGRLVRGISSAVAGAKVIVRAFAANPETGYDYVGVTRFGHRVARIYPKGRQFGSFNIATRKRRGYSGHRAALRMVIGGRVLYRASVAGYHPETDWADDALPEIEAQAAVVADRLGRKIEVRF